jgi:hypothetical protein
MTPRQKAIQEIESLYPPDCEYEDTARIGQELLVEAKRRCSSWKDEPDNVIFVLLQLCRDREAHSERTGR